LQRENSALCGLQRNRRHRPQAQVEKQKLSLAAALFPPAFGVMLRDARDIIQVIERTTHGRTNTAALHFLHELVRDRGPCLS
jgi:hypothetical protein